MYVKLNSNYKLNYLQKAQSSFSKKAGDDGVPAVPDEGQISPSKSQQHHIIPARNMTLCKQLGAGEFGSVWQAVWSLDNGSKMQVRYCNRISHAWFDE